MITKPSTLEKGQSLTFTMDRTQAAAAATDSYWSDSSKIVRAVVVYRSTVGNQRKKLNFVFSGDTAQASATWSLRARDEFYVEQIRLIDADWGEYELPSAALPSSASIDFNDTSEPPTTLYFGFSGTGDSTLAGFGSLSDSSVGGVFYS